MTIYEAKWYLGLDGTEQDALIATLIDASERTVEKVLRAPITEKTPDSVKVAVLYCLWQFYFHRDNSEFKASSIESTVAVMLSDIRKVEF